MEKINRTYKFFLSLVLELNVLLRNSQQMIFRNCV